MYALPNEDGSATSDKEMVAISQIYTQWVIKALTEKSYKSFHFKILGTPKTILQYWQADGTHYPRLQYLAIKAFSMPTSSTVSEQCFFNVWIYSLQVAE
jgi:hAT family C-terminal dimerisation region